MTSLSQVPAKSLEGVQNNWRDVRIWGEGVSDVPRISFCDFPGCGVCETSFFFSYPSPLTVETHEKVQYNPFVIKADKAHLQPAKNNAAVA